MKYLISEIDDDACCEIPRYICNTRADAEELILALAEEDALNWFNHNITWAPVPSGVYVLHEWKEMAAVRHKSLEHYILNEGSVLFFNKIYESEVPD